MAPSHDPFSPDAAADPNPTTMIERRAAEAAYASFPEERWVRAGADEDDLVLLREAHDARSPEEQAAEGQRIAGASTALLAAELEALRTTGSAEQPFGRTVEQVKEAVGEDAERAQAALEIEQARSKPRTTLVEHLEGVIAAAAPVEETAGDDAPGA